MERLSNSPSQTYPANTVTGRICLGLPLKWDKDTQQQTIDIYIKTRIQVSKLCLYTQ